jgi:hypothetical protein
MSAIQFQLGDDSEPDQDYDLSTFPGSGMGGVVLTEFNLANNGSP